jgi:hypothetical protein
MYAPYQTMCQKLFAASYGWFWHGYQEEVFVFRQKQSGSEHLNT